MQPLDMLDEERATMFASHAFAVDAEGREILVGLSREESEWLVVDRRTWLEQRVRHRRSPADKRRSAALAERHEVARLKAVALANAKPAGNA